MYIQIVTPWFSCSFGRKGGAEGTQATWTYDNDVTLVGDTSSTTY